MMTLSAIKNMTNVVRVSRDEVTATYSKFTSPSEANDAQETYSYEIRMRRRQDGWSVRPELFIDGKLVHDTDGPSERKFFTALMDKAEVDEQVRHLDTRVRIAPVLQAIFLTQEKETILDR